LLAMEQADAKRMMAAAKRKACRQSAADTARQSGAFMRSPDIDLEHEDRLVEIRNEHVDPDSPCARQREVRGFDLVVVAMAFEPPACGFDAQIGGREAG